jgi:hypothetical protein
MNSSMPFQQPRLLWEHDRHGPRKAFLRKARAGTIAQTNESRRMSKHSFSASERYAVWLHHEKRCWLCEEPLRLLETTIEHYLLGRSKAKSGDRRWHRDRIAIRRHYDHLVTCEAEPVSDRCAGVDDAEYNALVLLYLDWSSVPEHSIVDSRGVIGRIHRGVRSRTHVRIPVV